MYDVKGKKVILFGGTSGIGLAAAEQLAKLRAKVVAVSRDPSKAGKPPRGVKLAQCDATDEKAVAAFLKEQAPFDVLISAATGGDRAVGPFLKMDMEGFKGSFAKMWGYANVVRHGARHLSKNGCIVLVSGSPARKIKPGQIAIGSVGGAVEQFVRGVAPELTPKRINVVAPGFIDTPMVPLKGKARRDLYKNMTADHLIPRAGQADEIAQAIVFAVQNEFITGTTIDVDGGLLLS
ncbi:MAG: SDR family oxidoreductase [Pseudomonadota bacterium]